MINKRIHTIYGIILSAVTVIAGIFLIAACICIYHQGDRPFSPESVAAAFGTIAFPVYLCLALTIVGLLIDGISPAPKSKLVPQKQYALILEKLYNKHGQIKTPAISREQRRRKLHRSIAFGLLILGSTVFLFYGLNSGNFDSADITGSVVQAMYVLLPCIVVPFMYGVFSAYCTQASLKKEITLVKQAVSDGVSEADSHTGKAAPKPLLKLRWVLLAVGIFLLAFGFFTGGTEDVLTKAVNICTECVGLG